MTRFAIAALAVAFANVAHADSSAPAKQPTPDAIADVEGREANLESTEPRKGLTFAGSLGGSLMLGGDIGVGRGPSLSLRLGHVATRNTIITFELAIGSALHKAAMMSETLTDTNSGLFAGAQRYTSGSFWLRAAGGFTFLVKNLKPDGSGGEPAIVGVGGLGGAGLDLARWGYWVLGLEAFGILSASRDGVKAQMAFGLGIAHY